VQILNNAVQTGVDMAKRRACLVALTVAITAMVVTSVSAQDTAKRKASSSTTDWPRFRGPNGEGVSHATTVPVKWDAGDYNWITQLPARGHGSPVVVGERIYVVCGQKRTAERIVVCVAVGSGKVLWKRTFSSKKHRLHGSNSYGSSTPAADSTGVVVT
tara:strand:+ start:3107 stop:3583 length:477 start_codon:yes stop_codon:yes gene_type:complete